MVNEILEALDIQPSDTVFDGTLGFGGHAQKLAEKLDKVGQFIGCDKDPDALAHCKHHLMSKAPFYLFHGSYAQAGDFLAQSDCKKVDKLLIDCGMSSYQLDHPDRGFSFQIDAPLDMRMDSTQALAASTILNTYSKEALIQILSDYGDLYRIDRFISEILERRKRSAFSTTSELVATIKSGFYFRNSRRRYIQTCSRVFQALRIEVNQEFHDLISFLDSLSSILAKNGRISFLTFHSAEDRIVKRFFKGNPTFKALSKVIKAPQSEIKMNSRARSAKLRTYIHCSLAESVL